MRVSPTETKFSTRPTVEQFIDDLRRMGVLLEVALQDELDRSPIKDPALFNYPLLARDLAKRLANIRATIAALETAKSHSPNAA